MGCERLVYLAKTATPLLFFTVACLPLAKNNEGCKVDVEMQASYARSNSHTLYYEGDEIGRLDLSRVTKAATSLRLAFSFSGYDKKFIVTTDDHGKASLEIDLLKEEIDTKDPYLFIQTGDESPINKRVSCGDKRVLKALVPERIEPTTTLPTATITRTPIPTPEATPVSTPTQIRPIESRPAATPTPISVPTANSRIRNYIQCGGTWYDPKEQRIIRFPNNATVAVTEVTDNTGYKSYSTTLIGVLPHQCNNP